MRKNKQQRRGRLLGSVTTDLDDKVFISVRSQEVLAYLLFWYLSSIVLPFSYNLKLLSILNSILRLCDINVA